MICPQQPAGLAARPSDIGPDTTLESAARMSRKLKVATVELAALKKDMEANRALVLSFLQDSGIDPKEIAQGLPVVTDRQDERIQFSRPSLPRYRALVTLAVRSSNVDVVKKAIQSAD